MSVFAASRALLTCAPRRANVGNATTVTKACFSSEVITTGTEKYKEKGIMSKLWEKYSISGQSRRIEIGENFFRSAQQRANDPDWYGSARVGREFRPRHAILTMHLWFLHKRLIDDKVDPSLSLLIQEELFDTFWHDTKSRIRAEGVNELTVNKHLKDVQQYTFQHLTHYDHCFTGELLDSKYKERFELLGGLAWRHIYLQDEETPNDLIKIMAHYMEFQYKNIVEDLPEEYFQEGRIAWGNVPDFSAVRDNTGKLMEENSNHPDDVLPGGWQKALADSGDAYYWEPSSMKSSWERPV